MKATTAIKLDKERPEYHRVACFACSEGIYAISTGNQLSSRLMNTVGSNGFLIIPASKDVGFDQY